MLSTPKSQNIAKFTLSNVAFSVLVEEDGLKAYLTSDGLPFANQPVRTDYLLEELKRVLHPPFIDESCITDYVSLLNKGNSPKSRRIAKGIAAIIGQHARVVPLVRMLVDPSDSYPELTKNKFFENVAVGSTVARYYPPTEGLPGMNVVGQTLSCYEGKQEEILFDKESLQLKIPQQQIAEMAPGDFVPIVALKAGAFAKTDGVYHIRNTLELAAVESWMGDIDFVGSIQVHDSIEAGLVVRASETIHVGNRIENSMADAKEVIIEKAAKGTHQFNYSSSVEKGLSVGPADETNKAGYLVSSGTLTAGVIERCLIKSIGNINLKYGALNSMIVCCGNVIGPEASIVGGVTIADERIEVAILGSDVKVETLLTINNIEKNRSRRKLLQQLARVAREESALEEKLTLGFPSLKEALANPTDRVRILAQTLVKTQKVKKELERQLEAIPPGPENKDAGVVCHGRIYKGVSVSINGMAWTAEQDINGPVRITLVNSQVEMLRL